MTPDVQAAPSLSVLPSPAIEAEELSLSVGGASLLKRAEFTVRRGEIALLCAPSGAGKTILLKLLAGVLRAGHDGVAAEGRLRFEQTDLLSQRPPPGRVGILFQNHALFDELSARENVLFALRHRARGAAPAAAPDRKAGAALETVAAQQLLEGLGVGGAGRLRHLSGGQLQRVALARTLALDPDLILYDEPTTGLDTANARRVAELIRAAHGRRPRTTLIVTHDLEAFRDVAAAALWLDPASGKIERLSLDEAVTRAAQPQPIDAEARVASAGGQGRSLPARFLERTTDAVVAGGLAVVRLFPSWPRARYGLRYLGHYLRIAASPGAFLYVGVAGLLVGFVATYFTFEKMPRRDVTEPLFVDDVLSALGFMLFRVLAPVLVTLLVAARTGAAFAADVGGKVYARQFDALRSFGVDPSRYLLTGMLQSLLLAMPFLVWVMWWAAKLSALLVFLFTHPDRSAFFWERGFTRGLVNEDFFLHWGWMWVLAKTEACAFGIATIAWLVGSREKLAADDVSRAVTRTVILASLHVLLVHFLFSFIEF